MGDLYTRLSEISTHNLEQNLDTNHA